MIKHLLILLLILFGGFVGWMNVTPGHFQKKGCCICTVDYYVDVPANYCIALDCAPTCGWSLRDRFLLFVNKFDYNK